MATARATTQGILSLLLIAAAQAFQVPTNVTQPPLVFRNAPGVQTNQNQDIYGCTFHMTGFFSLGGAQYNLGFANSTPGEYTLAIAMNVDPGLQSTSRIIWEANRETPVAFNASISLGADGNLVLRDADGAFVWSTGTANLNATDVEVLQTGNLVVRSNDTILWESFNHPSDTLMVGQPFQPGMKLQSRSSLSDASPGRYSLVMEAGGLVLYSNLSGGAAEPYWVRSYYGVDTLAAATTTCEYLVSAALDGTGLNLNLDMSTSGNISSPPEKKSQSLCSLRVTSRLELKRTNTLQNQSFVRLEPDGNLRAYTLENLQLWDDPYQLFNDSSSCSLPGKCQPFGVCSNGVCTSCINSDGTAAVWSDTCTAPRVGSCTDVRSLQFLRLPGVEHFSSKYINASAATLEDCRSRCSETCSCSAFFYWEESSSCYMTDRVETLRTVDNQAHVAYVKSSRTESSGSSISKGAVAGIVVGGLLCALTILSLSIFLYKRRTHVEAVDYDSDNFLESIENLRPIRFNHSDLERITKNFSQLLGTGGFGGVYKGVLPDGRSVAVKKLESTGQGKKEFYAEVAVLGTIHHWNLVKLLGFCSEGSNRLLVYEYMENGSLDKWIYIQDGSNDKPVLTWEQRMEIVLGTARGLAYLHEDCTERIIHLDIKPQNILLNESFVAKVADFGLSRLMSREQSYVMTTMRGTPGYLAPEWLLEAAITEKSDVYSFGVVLLEVVSGKRNFSRVSETEKFYLPAYALNIALQGRDMELVDPRVKSQADESTVRTVIRIAFHCLQENSSARPSMSTVVQMLEGSCYVEDIPVDGLPFSSKKDVLPLRIENISNASTSRSYFSDSSPMLSAR